MSLLNIRSITQTFFTKKDWKVVLEDVSLDIDDGEFVSILGPSGCGKTTLLSVISGMLSPTNGAVILEGRHVNKPICDIGYMLQQDYLFPWLTIEENILLGLKITNNCNEDTKKNAIRLLTEVGLKDALHQMPMELSGGMRQRVALVRTLATEPKLLLLDEPFSALDYQTKIKLEELIFSTLKNFKKTAILVTHDIEEAIAVSDRIILLSRNPGKIAKEFQVPTVIRDASPLQARGIDAFHLLFNEIWKEMDNLEG